MLRGLKNKIGIRIRDYKLKAKLGELDIAKEGNNLFLLQTPTHTNIGDHAIADAQIQFIKTHFPDRHLVEVNQDLLDLFVKEYAHKLAASDTVLIHGGGNFGNQYIREEAWRRLIISSFPANKIISLPQTIYYTDDAIGKVELAKTQAIVAAHDRVTLIAREQLSFELMKGYFPTATVLLVPDTVLSLSKATPRLQRSGILMVLRDDEEKILTDAQHAHLHTLAHTHFSKVTYSDMHCEERVLDSMQRDAVLQAKMDQFKSAQLVITDRLHGMVFAAITETPCIAFSNYNQKVSGTYEWIKELDYIRFVTFSEESIESLITELKLLESVEGLPKERHAALFQQIVTAIAQ